MQDEKSRTGGVTPTKEDAGQDATSKETVGDIGKGGESPGSQAGESPGGSSGSSATPSPDGQFDGTRDGAGPGEETGPM